jgi:hypothetical protein
MEHIQLNAWSDLIRSLVPDGLNDASSFDEEMMEYEEKVKDDPQ